MILRKIKTVDEDWLDSSIWAHFLYTTLSALESFWLHNLGFYQDWTSVLKYNQKMLGSFAVIFSLICAVGEAQ